MGLRRKFKFKLNIKFWKGGKKGASPTPMFGVKITRRSKAELEEYDKRKKAKRQRN